MSARALSLLYRRMATPRQQRLFRKPQQLQHQQQRTLTRVSTIRAEDGWHGDENIVIEPPRKKRDETVDQLRSRLQYQSRKRGIKENDLIFSTFCNAYLHGLTEDQLKRYDTILNDHGNEWDMYNWITAKDVRTTAPPSSCNLLPLPPVPLNFVCLHAFFLYFFL